MKYPSIDDPNSYIAEFVNQCMGGQKGPIFVFLSGRDVNGNIWKARVDRSGAVLRSIVLS